MVRVYSMGLTPLQIAERVRKDFVDAFIPDCYAVEQIWNALAHFREQEEFYFVYCSDDTESQTEWRKYALRFDVDKAKRSVIVRSVVMVTQVYDA